MKQVFEKSDLVYGEALIVPSSIFVEKDKSKERLVKSIYVGETNAGIIIDCFFIPPFGKKPEDAHYKIMLNWSSIYCGALKVMRTNGERLCARLVKEKETYVKKEETEDGDIENKIKIEEV